MTSKIVDLNINQAPSSRLWFVLIFTYLLFPLTLQICGRNIYWWQAWVFSALLFFAGIGGRFLAEKRHPGLLVERASIDKALKAKPSDKVLAPLMAISISKTVGPPNKGCL